MKRLWIIIGSLFLGSAVVTSAPKGENAPAAGDTWNPAKLPGVTASTATAKDPVKEEAAPVHDKVGLLAPVVQREGLNEMRGKLLSKNYDPRTVRLLVAGGFNVEFTYDIKSVFSSDGKAISVDDLGYNDEIVLRYLGKDLYAIEIERLAKAARPE